MHSAGSSLITLLRWPTKLSPTHTHTHAHTHTQTLPIVLFFPVQSHFLKVRLWPTCTVLGFSLFLCFFFEQTSSERTSTVQVPWILFVCVCVRGTTSCRTRKRRETGGDAAQVYLTSVCKYEGWKMVHASPHLKRSNGISNKKERKKDR